MHDELRGASTRLEQRLGVCLVNFRRKLPRIHRFFTSPPNVYWWPKALLGLPFGLLLGWGFYHSVVTRIGLPERPQKLVGAIFAGSIGIGYACSVQIRCISLLVLPTFFGKNGRSYVGAFALALILTGPVTTIMFNAKEATRAMTCSSVLAHNMTAARLKLRLTPVKHIMVDLQRQASNMQHTVSKVKERFRPVQEEVEDEEEVARLRQETEAVDGPGGRERVIEARHDRQDGRSKVEKNYDRKLDYRCEEVYSLGAKACKKAFMDAEKRCMDKLSIVGYLLCWPLKLTMLCDLANLLPKMTGANCDAQDAVNPGFGQSFSAAEAAADEMNRHFDVNLQYRVVEMHEDVDVITPEDVAKAIAYELTSRQKYFDFFMSIFKKVLAFMFIRVIYGAFKYHKKYISDFKHDNLYITMYYRWIDQRRGYQGKRTLLPLKKGEKAVTIVPNSAKLSKPEKAKLGSGTFRLLARLITFLLVVFIDRLVFEVLDLVRKHTRVDYVQTGVHRVNAKVYGDGVMADLVRGLLHGFNQHHTMRQHISNSRCLPQPQSTPSSFMWNMLGMFALLELLIVLEAYGLRLRRLLAGFFYRRREKKRTLYLYNDMLKKRKGFLRHTRKQVARKARQQRLEARTGALESYVKQFPRLLGWLRRFGVGKKRCLICDEKQGKGAVVCPNAGCRFTYCRECWEDISGLCYACREEEDWSSDLSSSDEEVV